MSNPNIVNVINIAGNTGVQLVTTSPTAIVTNSSSSGKIYKINAVIVSNVDSSSSAALTVDLYRNNTAYRIINEVSILSKSSFTPIDKSLCLYLLEGDALRLTASNNNRLEAICTWEEISDV
jgi:hypothetical protein